MRKFAIYNQDKTKKLDLSSKEIFVVEPQGLGSSFSFNNIVADHTKTQLSNSVIFDDIILKAYLNIDNSSGYENYNKLISFISSIEKMFILEYNDGINTRCCDVSLKKITKSERNREGIFIETITLERYSYWYEEMHYRLGRIEHDPQYPMKFAFGFQGHLFNNDIIIENQTNIPYPLKIRIIADNFASLGDQDLRIELVNSDVKESEYYRDYEAVSIKSAFEGSLTIDSANKVVLHARRTSPNSFDISSGYYLLNKDYNTFLYIKKGFNKITINSAPTDKGHIDIWYRKYTL